MRLYPNYFNRATSANSSYERSTMKTAKPKFEDVIKKVKFLQTGHRSILRQLVRGFYDIQKLRISIGNRLCANFYVKIGVDPGQKLEEADNWGKEILTYYVSEYNKLSDFIAGNTRKLKKVLDDYKGIISSKAEFGMVQTFINFSDQETYLEKQMADYLEYFPIWTTWMKQVCGLGPLMAGVMISEYDIHKARYVSSLWKYAGLDVHEGEGRCRKSHHLVEQSYINRDGKPDTKMGISFNPFLKTKLLGVLGPSLLKQHGRVAKADGIGLRYGTIYYDYKNRLIQRREVDIMRHSSQKNITILEAEKDVKKIWPDGRIHNASIRYMVKMLIQDLYPVWKEVEGLNPEPTYQEAKLGMDLSHHLN